MKIQITPRFERSIKKLHKNEVQSLNQAIKAVQELQKPNESLSTQIMNFASSTSGKVVIGLTVVGVLYYFSQRR